MQLVAALLHMHRHGWCHLDVSPENCMVDGDRLVLIDFGCAQQAPPGGIFEAGHSRPGKEG